ncbi:MULTISPECIES: HNH endonuclease [Pontibacillus]|uniref:HNH endonuclease n=1 Tax=Pontibacillus chungwhensis TaxID=265426 RepID=A0ABY8V033_9BACI|nr:MULTISPECIES: HNH endonuclease [Pontibacillus]MCD5325007.1 HNH endonuclease [Pontibacillus sp. HN14]WIF98960.1 HNH endonuclease [Pontibacillus chungwhensis]
MAHQETCELCGRSPLETTEHHLVPRQFGGAEGPTADLCKACHKQIHALFTNAELAGFYNTLERLRDHPDMEKYLKWVKKQDPQKKITIKKSNRKK